MNLDTSDLPAELLSQLSTKTDGVPGAEQRVIDALTDLGTGNYDEMLVSIYRRHKKIVTRVSLQNTVMRMHKKGMVKRTGFGRYALVRNPRLQDKPTATEQTPVPAANEVQQVTEKPGCEECGGDFRVGGMPFKGKRFCSPQCIKNYRKRLNGGSCANCGGVLPDSAYTHMRKLFCKPSCVKAYRER